jgi:hypothetical protein
VDWINLAQNRYQCRYLSNTVLNYQIIKDAESPGQLVKKNCSVKLIHAFLTCTDRTLQFLEII